MPYVELATKKNTSRRMHRIMGWVAMTIFQNHSAISADSACKTFHMQNILRTNNIIEP